MNNLTKDLQDIVFNCAGGISDMGRDEISAILDAVIKDLPDYNIESGHDQIHSITFKTGALAYKTLVLLELSAAKRSE